MTAGDSVRLLTTVLMTLASFPCQAGERVGEARVTGVLTGYQLYLSVIHVIVPREKRGVDLVVDPERPAAPERGEVGGNQSHPGR